MGNEGRIQAPGGFVTAVLGASDGSRTTVKYMSIYNLHRDPHILHCGEETPDKHGHKCHEEEAYAGRGQPGRDHGREKLSP